MEAGSGAVALSPDSSTSLADAPTSTVSVAAASSGSTESAVSEAIAEAAFMERFDRAQQKIDLRTLGSCQPGSLNRTCSTEPSGASTPENPSGMTQNQLDRLLREVWSARIDTKWRKVPPYHRLDTPAFQKAFASSQRALQLRDVPWLRELFIYQPQGSASTVAPALSVDAVSRPASGQLAASPAPSQSSVAGVLALGTGQGHTTVALSSSPVIPQSLASEVSAPSLRLLLHLRCRPLGRWHLAPSL